MEKKDLKTELFKKVDAYVKVYREEKAQFGEYHEFTRCTHAAFCAVYQLVEACGLEDEYQAYKAANTEA